MSIGNDERITLDRGTFKALASETRVDILKHLDGTQKTVSELARELNMNKATMYQHLEQLREVGLVKRLDGDERMTTIKPEDPLEAPEIGPPRKWVYYKLTFKGKNVVNPGKVRFAVMLAVVGIISVAIIAILLANVALNPSQGPAPMDTIPPEFGVWTTPEANTETKDYSFSIRVQDSPMGRVVSGLKEENVTLYYGIGDKEEGGPNVVGWTELESTHVGDKYSAKLPDMDWLHSGGKYLYLKVTAWDLAGNSNTTGRVVYISDLKEEDLGFGDHGARVEGGGGGSGAYGVTANIKNFGNTISGSTTIGVYTRDPDLDNNGILDPDMDLAPYTVTTLTVGPIEPGKETNVTAQVTNTQLRNIKLPPESTGRVYFAIDPGNKLKEESKTNNVESVVPPSDFMTYIKKYSGPNASKMGSAPGFEVIALLGALAVVVAIKARRSPRDE